MFNFLKKVFGTKYDKDVKEYDPVVSVINDYFEQYKSLSNDELRNKTFEFRERIKEHLTGINGDIDALQERADNENDLNVKEDMFNDIDGLIKERDKHLEAALKEIRPEAFAVVKETARRFSENDTLVVSATQNDRDLCNDRRRYGYMEKYMASCRWRDYMEHGSL